MSVIATTEVLDSVLERIIFISLMEEGPQKEEEEEEEEEEEGEV